MIEKVHAAGILFEDENGKLLVLRRNSETPQGNTWGLVGGKLDEGEASQVAAARKVKGGGGLYYSARFLAVPEVLSLGPRRH